MILKLRRVGNSQGLVLPQAILRDLGVKPGAELEVRVSRGRLEAKPAEPHYTLEELLAQFRPEHVQPETGWGPDVGEEILPGGEPY